MLKQLLQVPGVLIVYITMLCAVAATCCTVACHVVLFYTHSAALMMCCDLVVMAM
jgi:hypothetical protein